MQTGAMNDVSIWASQGPVTSPEYPLFSIINVVLSSYLVIQNKNKLVVTIVSVLTYNAGQNRQMPEHT